MATSTITLRYINPPGPGKKNASIKDTKDDFYLLDPAMAEGLSTGVPYNVEYQVKQFGNTNYKIVDKITEVRGNSGAAGPSSAATKGKYGTVDMETAERIFVCGALNAMLSNQNTLPFTILSADIVTRVNILREVWRQTLGNPQQSAELQDEIPFP